MMNELTSVPIGDYENEQQESSVDLFKCIDRFPNGPFGERTLHSWVPCLYSPSHGFLHHTIGSINNVL